MSNKDLIIKEISNSPLVKKEYKTMLDNIHATLPAIKQSSSNFYKSHSQFMGVMLDVTAITPIRSVKHTLAEIDKTRMALEEAHLKMRKKDIELREKEHKLKTDLDMTEFEKELLETEILEIQVNMNNIQNSITGAIRKMNFFRCLICLTPNTRPRVQFVNGICNACINWKTKKNIKWDKREKELNRLCNKYRSKDGSFDVVVPGGGGKDSSYVAWKLKNRYKMNPLCVCVQPPLDTNLGKVNLDNFTKSGFNVLEIKPNRAVTSSLAKKAFTKYGNPQLDWLFAIHSAPIRVAKEYKIPFIMWGEEAESEYGGSDAYKNKAYDCCILLCK